MEDETTNKYRQLDKIYEPKVAQTKMYITDEANLFLTSTEKENQVQ